MTKIGSHYSSIISTSIILGIDTKENGMKYERKMMMQRNMKSKNSFKENMRLLCLIWGRKWLANWIDSKNNKIELGLIRES